MNDCPICLTQIENPYFLKCGHIFCTDCILDWATTSKNTCPMCRTCISEPIIYNKNIVAFPVFKEIGITLYHCCNETCICVESSQWNLLNSFHIVSVDGHTNHEIEKLSQVESIVKKCKRENRMCKIVGFSQCPYV